MKTILSVLGLIALVSPAKSEDSASAALALPFDKFDQTPHAGWRALAQDTGHFREAAVLIDGYLAAHPALDRFQRSMLHWHALQVLAMGGDTAEALKHLPATRLDPEPPNSPIRWNDYVDATEAFLRHDRAKLLAARDRIASNQPDDPNLPIVDSFIAHFDETYAKAYRTEK